MTFPHSILSCWPLSSSTGVGFKYLAQGLIDNSFTVGGLLTHFSLRPFFYRLRHRNWHGYFKITSHIKSYKYTKIGPSFHIQMSTQEYKSWTNKSEFVLTFWSTKLQVDMQCSPASSGSRCRLWKRRTKGGSGQVVRSRTDTTKTLLCAQSTLYLPKPSSLSAQEINTPSSLSLGRY